MTHRYFLDTEFLDNENETTMISIALVCDDDRELYFANSEWLAYDGSINTSRADDWLRANVFPHIPPCTCPRYQTNDHKYGPNDERFIHQDQCRWRHPTKIRDAIAEFVKDPGDGVKPEVWAYYASYDWFLFCKLFGRMLNMPKHFPWLVNDLKTWSTHMGFKGKFRDLLPDAGHHDALADAKWNRTAHYLVLQHLAARDTFDENKRAGELADKLLDDLGDRSGFSVDSDIRDMIRPDWIMIITQGMQPRS